MNPYESPALLRQYLDFHYKGDQPDYLPLHPLPEGVLGYPQRCAALLTSHAQRRGRALDLGCAVGGSSFSLSRDFDAVTGVDASAAFIETATKVAENGVFRDTEDAWVPVSAARKSRVCFSQGDACALDAGLGVFDAVLMANLLCRLPDPAACLAGLRAHVAPGSVIAIMTPCSWDVAYTPREKWLWPTLAGIADVLGGWCALVETREMPFVIREHTRKAQFTVAEASVWRVCG